MKRLLDKRDRAEKHVVIKGDTLADLAAHYRAEEGDYPRDLTWEDLAMFNWATTEKREVTRALCERIGTATADALKAGKDPESLVLDPAFGPDGAKEILIPKVWKSPALAVEKTHAVTVRTRMPATALGFQHLDKWFIPDLEACEIQYALDGDAARADQVDLEVYGSKYCRLSGWNDGLPGFADLPDVPVARLPQDGANATARSAPRITTFRGLANCTEGVLAKPASGPEKPLNVAFSPYTVSLRFYRKTVAADAKARLELEPFWPRFDAADAPVAESCRIKWKVRETDRLKRGLLQVVDKDGRAVYMRGIGAGKLGKDAANEYAWDGKLADGVATITPAGMPYRVQIDAHTDIDEENGLAVSAMHTEVRLYVDPATHPRTLDPYDPATDRTSLDLSIADVFHKAADPTKDADGKLWTKLRLAQAGFHPGPVSDGATNPHFESALNEFQRSVPKHGGRPGRFERLALTAGGDDDADTRAALESLPAERTRPWFGDPVNRSDHADPQHADFKARLQDPAARLIVWVDDRNWYTDFAWIGANDSVNPTIRSIVTGDPAEHGNLRGEYTAGDAKTDYDAGDIARPWIPLQVDFRLLSRTHGLDSVVAAEADPDRIAKIRRTIGPLRIDWTFDEIETTAVANVTIGGAAQALPLPVLDPEVENCLADLGHRDRTRTRIALRWALDQLKASHARKDVNRTSSYYNAPADCGGIRPDPPDTYYSEAFGVDAESLLPCQARTDPARESILTVVHDDLGQGGDDVFPKRLGRSGVYFHPSRIAGDGYRVRAQVRCEDHADYGFPNRAALDARYPRLPQAQSSALRLWRKSAIRGYVGWGPTNSWAAAPVPPRPNFPPKGPDGFRGYYIGCHVHVANELGKSNAGLDHSPAALFASADDYRKAVRDCLAPKDRRRKSSWIAVHPTFWPWSGHEQFGVPEASQPNLDIDAGIGDLNDRIVGPHMTRYALRISLELVRQIERQKGLMRGNVIVEYQTTPPAYRRRYQCKRCNDTFTYVQNAPGPILAGNKCPTPGCGTKLIGAGKLRSLPLYQGNYTCNGAPGHVIVGPNAPESSAGGGAYDGFNCPTCGGGVTMAADQIDTELYRCGRCGFEAHFAEPGAPAARGSHQDGPCPTGCGGRLKSRKKPLVRRNHVTILPAAPGDLLRYSSGGIATPGLLSSSLGNPVGVALNFLGDSDLWGHEMAHNRHFEHAGNAPGRSMDQHDTGDNDTVNWADPAINEADPSCKSWDRTCLMTYGTDMPTFDDALDKVCFCYGCVLKNRGWKLNGPTPVPVPPGDLQDP